VRDIPAGANHKARNQGKIGERLGARMLWCIPAAVQLLRCQGLTSMPESTNMANETDSLTAWQVNPDLAGLDPVSPADHCASLRHFAAGVTVISSADQTTRAALTATAVCSVTADPPRLVVFVNKNVRACAVIMASGNLCVNLLAADQQDIAMAFAGMLEGVDGEKRFDFGTWGSEVTGAPVLQDALATFDCRVVSILDESTHQAFLCEVLSTRSRTDCDALIYINGGFQRIAH